MNSMIYKGYVGAVRYDDACKLFVGNVINAKTDITFQGVSVRELSRTFHRAVENYLQWCKDEGIEPEKPYSGRISVRLDPEVHQRAAIQAKINGIDLNDFIEKAVEDALSAQEG